MRHGLFFRFFPAPQYLSRPVIGLDLSDRSIKYFQLSLRGRNYSIRRFGEKEVSVGLVEAGQIRDEEALIKFLVDFRRELRAEFIVASLPEEQAYVFRLQLPAMKARDLRSAIELQLEEHVPLLPVDAVFDYEVLSFPGNTEKHYDLAVAVISKKLVTDYTRIFTSAGFKLLALEVEAQAIARTVVAWSDAGTQLVIDLGKMRTSFFVVTGGVVVYTSTISNIGGEAITQAVKRGLDISYEQAEKLKVEQGLLPSGEDKRLMFSILPIVSVLHDEAVKLLNYWQTHLANTYTPARMVTKIIVSGGQATLPGLIEYLSANLGLPVDLANIWNNILDPARVVPPISLNQSQKYATSLGLALRPWQLEFHD